jgi:glycerol uptake facilitator-like aquaporin
MFKRNRVAMLVAEFLGTGVLTLAVLSVQRSQLGLAYFVALAAGLTVALLTYTFSNISGAQMNPALTIALATARRIRAVPALTYIVAQLLGAWAAYGLYHYFVNTDVQQVSQDFSGRILVAEAIGTMVFALGWAAAAYKRFEEGRFAAVAGLSFAVAIIVASAASVGLANPALAVGVRAWELFGENGLLNYAVGPLLGAVIGVNLYGLLFAEGDRPGLFSGLRGRRADVTAGTVSTSELADVDEDDDEVVKPARKKTAAKSVTTSAAASKLAKARKTTATTRKATTTKRAAKR